MAASLVAVLEFPVTSPVTLPVTFPVTFPVKDAVIVPAIKLPLASRLTIVLIVLFSVAAFANSSAVCIVEEVDPPTLLTVGAAAMPVRSPESCILPFAVVVASGVAVVIALSTKSLTDLTVGYLVLEVPSFITSVLLLDKFSLKPNLVIKLAVSAIRASIL